MYLPLDPGLGLYIGRWGVEERVKEGAVTAGGTIGGVGGHVDYYGESRIFAIKGRRGPPRGTSSEGSHKYRAAANTLAKPANSNSG